MLAKVSNDFSTPIKKDSCRSSSCASACLGCVSANKHSVPSSRRSPTRPTMGLHSCVSQRLSQHSLLACAVPLKRLASLSASESYGFWLRTFWWGKIPSPFVTAFRSLRPRRKTAARSRPKAKITFCVRGVVSPLLANLFLHYGAPGQTWCFQRVKFPPRQEVQPPHRESSLGSEEVTNRTKRRQSDERAVTKVKRLSLVKYSTAGRQHRSGWKALVGSPQMARWPETAAGSVSTARSDMEASRDLGDPLWSWFACRADRVCRTIRIIPEKGRCCSAKSDSLIVLRARESRVHGEAAKQMKTDFRETSPAPTEAGI